MEKISRILKILPNLSTLQVDTPVETYDPLKNLKPGVFYKLGVCGLPMTRLDYYSRRETLPDFLKAHAAKVRHTMAMISQLTGEQIDEMLFNTTHPLALPAAQAECAFTSLAWHTFFDPYAHPKRKHYFKKDFLIPIIEKSAESYYKWAIYIRQQPDEKILGKMKTMHPQTAEHYYDYCANLMIAQREGVDASWLTTW